MTADRENPTPSSGDRGVFGNLPSERPGVRSPRRGQGKGSKTKASGSETAEAGGAEPKAPGATPGPPPKAAARRPPREQSAPPPAPEAEAREAESGRGTVEEAAWAGITVAAEAATLGVRLLSRALEAVRERR